MTQKRLWELDFLRGIAILLVIAFHVFYDLKYFFGVLGDDPVSGFWRFEQKLAAVSFIMLAGVAGALIGQRYSGKEVWRKNGLRAARLISLGMVITLATGLFNKSMTVWFGILHFLGTAILLTTPLLRFRWVNVALGLAALSGGVVLAGLRAETAWGLPLGLRPFGFQSFDYYPLLPWFGVLLFGIAAGNGLYPSGEAKIKRPPHAVEKPLIFLGKHSLAIYLLHQPLILGLLTVLLG